LQLGARHLIRFVPIFQFLRKNNVFGDPVFRTPYIEAKVNVSEGSVQGRVLKGEFENRELHSLSEAELDNLESVLKAEDRRAYYLLQVIRKRTQTQSSDFHSDNGLSNPSVEEAHLMLGLPETFNSKDVNQAYKRLMQKLHPDRGGNDYLASRINLARDILIKHLGEK